MTTENELIVSPADEAAEEAAFAAAFTAERGDEDANATANTVVPDEGGDTPAGDGDVGAAADTGAEDSGQGDAPATPEPAAAPIKIAGLTEEQLAQAVARIGQQQATIDKLGGRLGALMQQVDKLREIPRTAAEQRTFDLKLEKLSESFPELAEILRDDLKVLNVPAAPAPAAEAPKTYTAEEVENLLNQKLTAFQQQQNLTFEIRTLNSVHPDWEQVIRTPSFALWRDNVIQDGKELMESEDAAFISRRLSEFKDWVKGTSSPAHPAPAATPAPAGNKQVLAAAVMPRSAPKVAAAGPVSEDDAFEAAFVKERSKANY